MSFIHSFIFHIGLANSETVERSVLVVQAKYDVFTLPDT